MGVYIHNYTFKNKGVTPLDHDEDFVVYVPLFSPISNINLVEQLNVNCQMKYINLTE